MNSKLILSLGTVLLASVSAQAGWSNLGSFTGSQGSLSASAAIWRDTGASSSNLKIVLTNTSTSDVSVPADVLTAFLFNIAAPPTLTPVSASINADSAVSFAGSTVFLGSTPLTIAGGNVGGEWGFLQNAGTSSSGFGIFGGLSAGNFGGPNLQGPVSLDGLQYGITSASDLSSTGNAAVQNNALIKNAVVFTFSVDNINALTAASFSNMSFQYGTSLTEPSFPAYFDPAPEPGFYGALALGLGSLLWLRRRNTI